MMKTRFDFIGNETKISNRNRSPTVPRVRENSPNAFIRSSPTSSQSNLEILTEEDEETSQSTTTTTNFVSVTINRSNSSNNFSKHQSSLPTIIESQDAEQMTTNNNQTNVDERTTKTFRQFTIEKRIYELLQQQRDVRQDKSKSSSTLNKPKNWSILLVTLCIFFSCFIFSTRTDENERNYPWFFVRKSNRPLLELIN